jgi:hypothetical protein
MKLICLDNEGTSYNKIPLIVGNIYEGEKCSYGGDNHRWEIVGHKGISYYPYRFKEFKCVLSNNIEVI